MEYEYQNNIIASVDICFHLTNLRNLTQTKLGPIVISLSMYHSQSLIGIPYQIIPKDSLMSLAQIDLQNYISPKYYLNSNQILIIDELIIFKIHFPIEKLESASFKCLVTLETINQLAFQQNQQRTVIDQYQLTFNSMLYVESFIPVIFSKYGISLEGTLYTHLLTCKYNNLCYTYRHKLYQTIDHLVICYNKLKQKVNLLAQNLTNCKQNQNQNGQVYKLLPKFIDMNQYIQYQQIKSFVEKRIFKDSIIMKQHRKLLANFIQKFIPQMTQKLLYLWKQFLNTVTYQFSQNYKIQYFVNLSIEIKKRVQYRFEKNSTQITTLNNSKNRKISFFGSKIKQSCNFIDNNIVSQQKNLIAINQFKQNFYEKNIKSQINNFIVSNQQIRNPSLKVLLNKTLKEEQKNSQGYEEPHIVVLVHGLGASSSAFHLYQIYFKYIYGNIFILNSSCNQKFTDEPIDQMGRRLTFQVQNYITQNKFGENFKLSFIGHSLGGLIIRAALPKLQKYKYNMKTFITLSTPHLGYFFHNSMLNKAGMWALSTFSENKIMNCLLMTQNKRNQYSQEVYFRESLIYNLSRSKGIQWFQDLMLFGSQQDQFVGPLSALINTQHQIKQRKTLKAQIWQQMRLNLQQSLKSCNVYRGIIEFNQNVQTNFKDNLLGRKSHVLYLSSQNFIYYIMLVYRHLFL